jgi:hypothetical protein
MARAQSERPTPCQATPVAFVGASGARPSAVRSCTGPWVRDTRGRAPLAPTQPQSERSTPCQARRRCA